MRGEHEAAVRIEREADQPPPAMTCSGGSGPIDAQPVDAAAARERVDDVESPRSSNASPCGRPNPSWKLDVAFRRDAVDRIVRRRASAPVTYRCPSGPNARWNAATLGGSCEQGRPAVRRPAGSSPIDRRRRARRRGRTPCRTRRRDRWRTIAASRPRRCGRRCRRSGSTRTAGLRGRRPATSDWGRR